MPEWASKEVLIGKESRVGKPRIAVIGAGRHATKFHYPALSALEEAELCAACDIDQERLDQVTDTFGISAGYTDFRQMISKEKPDGVVIVMLPIPMVDIALACIEMGQNVLIEKPPGSTSADAQQMLDAAHAQGCKAMVSMDRRFIPLVNQIRSMTAERGGALHCAATYNKAGFTGNAWTWPSYLTVADGIHMIDLMVYLCGDVKEVYAVSQRYDAEFVNTCSALVAFESGAMGSANNHQCVGGRVQKLEVHAPGLSAYLDLATFNAATGELWLDNRKAELPESEEHIPEGVVEGAYLEARHFARWIAGEEEALADLSDVVRSVRLCEAMAAGYQGPMNAFPWEDAAPK